MDYAQLELHVNGYKLDLKMQNSRHQRQTPFLNKIIFTNTVL